VSAGATGALMLSVSSPPPPDQEETMSDNAYSRTEIVGSSEIGIDDAIRGAITRASQTLDEIGWFEVSEIRGEVHDGEVGHLQVTLGVGFTLRDTKP
jgi:flavin-binding protein dodecin